MVKVTTIEPDRKVQLPSEWVEELGLHGTIALEMEPSPWKRQRMELSCALVLALPGTMCSPTTCPSARTSARSICPR